MIALLFLTSSTLISAVPLENSTSVDRTPLVGELLSESCNMNYKALSCLKALAASLVPAMSIPRKLNIWPGMSLLIGGFEIEPVTSSQALDGYLVKALKSLLSSFSLQIRVLDQDVANGLRRISRTVVGTEEARSRRKRVNNAILLGGLLGAGTILALGMIAISAMAGKALFMSLVSSGMMMMNKKSGNGGDKGVASYPKTTYEIIHSIPEEDIGRRNGFHTGQEYQIIKNH